MAKKKRGGAKTMPMRVLEEKGIPYQVRMQSHKEVSAEGVAADLGIPVAQVLKAMLVEREGDLPGNAYALVVIPGDKRLSLKKVAAEMGEKNVRLAAHRDVQRVTGYQVGSVSVIGFRREDVETLVDARVNELDQVVISAGRPDTGLSLRTEALLRALNEARIGDYCED